MKKLLLILWCILLLICIGTLIFVGLNRPSPPETLTAEQQKIRELIAQLGHEEWSKRIEASQQLRQIGEPALPFLARAFRSYDDEIRPRARSISRWIESPPQQTEFRSWAHLVRDGLEAMGLTLTEPAPQLADLQAAPPVPEAAPQPLPPPIPNMQRAQMPNLPNINLPHPRGGRPPGIAGGLLGGGLLGGRGGAGNLLGQMQQLMMLRMMQGGGRGGGARNIPPPDLSDLSLDLTATVGLRLTEAADGLRVTDVRPGSPAAGGGVRAGDILQKIDGRQMTTLADAKEVFTELNPGRTLHLVVLRKEDSIKLVLRF